VTFFEIVSGLVTHGPVENDAEKAFGILKEPRAAKFVCIYAGSGDTEDWKCGDNPRGERQYINKKSYYFHNIFIPLLCRVGV